MADRSGGIKILVVDDEKLIRLTMSAKLKSAGYTPVAVGSVEEAVSLLKEHHRAFSAIISDIMMGDMDGFVFRDIVRGFDSAMPFFFLTALDPEEGSGFLKKIVEDPMSYYLPKSVDTKVLLHRVQRIVASRRVEQFISRQVDEQKQSLALAAHVQRSMLPQRMLITQRGFYTTWWRPQNIVSGDLYEAVQFGFGRYLYVLGDIQGHGTSAALAMTAVQSFIKQLTRLDGVPSAHTYDIANMMHRFFRANLADVSYMTALICIHDPVAGHVCWLSCGAPDLLVIDEGKAIDPNPEKKGGMPIGLMPETEYTAEDEVLTQLSDSAVCVLFTDGIQDLSRTDDGDDAMGISDDKLMDTRVELVSSARSNGSMLAAPYRIMKALAEDGFTNYRDDMTTIMFGARHALDGIYEATVPIAPDKIDDAAQAAGKWCATQGWSQDLVERMLLVIEEKLMNVHDHGFDDRERLHEVAGMRLRKLRDCAELTVWECGTPEPSMEVAAGNADTAFELANIGMRNHGRGRLMVRSLCRCIARNRIGNLNETIYYIPFDGQTEKEPCQDGGAK